MDHASDLYRFVRFANCLLFAFGLALMLDRSTAAAFDRFDQVPHWRSQDRQIVVVDRTGDKAWNDATSHAVAVWNRAAGGTGISLRWTTGTGECQPDGSTIALCQEPYQSLGDAQDDREGLTDLRLGPDRTQAHIGGVTIAVCSNCHLDPARRRVVATHELGHALGLSHSLRRSSVMFPSGGPDRPESDDVAALRQLYAHVDQDDRCGVFNLALGAFCF